MTSSERFLHSRKARALVIALLNCDVIFFTAIFTDARPELPTTAITASLALAALYVGGQSAVDTATVLRSQPSKDLPQG